MAILKPKSTENTPKNAKRQLTENQKNSETEYKQSVGLVFAFNWPAESNRPSSHPSVTPLQQAL